MQLLFWRRRKSFRHWLRSRRRLSDYLDADRGCLPIDASPQEILKHMGHFHESDFRSWVGADLKAALREWRSG